MSGNAQKRITTWHFGDLPVPVDADEQWDDMKNSTFAEQIEKIADGFFWIIQLPWIDLPATIRETFWEEFMSPGKERARKIAVFGLKYCNNEELFQLLLDSIGCEKSRSSGKFKDSPDYALQSFALIGVKFAEMASKKDHRIFQQMADIIKAGGIDGGVKGGEDSFNGQVIRDFCQLVLAERTLPTKKQLRESLGLSDDKVDTEKLRIALKELGLGGLPRNR
ncbi:MAG: hypothetical protein V4689_05960 [Verrucomicrobiota bacterium]